jgi:hypothetical protein
VLIKDKIYILNTCRRGVGFLYISKNGTWKSLNGMLFTVVWVNYVDFFSFGEISKFGLLKNSLSRNLRLSLERTNTIKKEKKEERSSKYLPSAVALYIVCLSEFLG